MEKKDFINLLKECNAIQFGRFVLTSGAVSKSIIWKYPTTRPVMISGNEIIVMTEDQALRLVSLELIQQLNLEIKLILNDV